MRTWKCRWPGSTASRAASSRFVSGSSDWPSACSTFRRSGWPSAFSCSGRSSSRTSVGLGCGCGVLIARPTYPLRRCRGRPRQARREPGKAGRDVRGDISRRMRARPHLPSQRRLTRNTTRLRRLDRRHRERDPVDPRLEPGRAVGRAPVGDVELRRAGEERCHVPVGPRPSSRKSSVASASAASSSSAASARRRLAADPVDRRPAGTASWSSSVSFARR